METPSWETAMITYGASTPVKSMGVGERMISIKQYDYYTRDESGLGVCARMRSFFSEWCSKECFWNDFLAQVKAEMAKAGKKT